MEDLSPACAKITRGAALQVPSQERQDDAPVGGRAVAFEVNVNRAGFAGGVLA